MDYYLTGPPPVLLCLGRTEQGERGHYGRDEMEVEFCFSHRINWVSG